MVEQWHHSCRCSISCDAYLLATYRPGQMYNIGRHNQLPSMLDMTLYRRQTTYATLSRASGARPMKLENPESTIARPSVEAWRNAHWLQPERGDHRVRIAAANCSLRHSFRTKIWTWSVHLQ
eukprot:scaffold237982_cov18-Prasinocladus_malaysianus.AAC.1